MTGQIKSSGSIFTSCTRGKLLTVAVIGIAAFGLAWYLTNKSCKKQRKAKKTSSKSEKGSSVVDGSTSSTNATSSTSGTSVASNDNEKPQESNGQQTQ